MSNSPVPTPRHSQTEILSESPTIRTSTPIADTSISEKTDLSQILKTDDLLKTEETDTSSTPSHADENIENEAVGKIKR